MSDLISVVVPVYNAVDYLEECVNSILNQSYSNIEIFLVNDGSSDGSDVKCNQLAELDKRIKVIHKENGGASTARNAGVRMASGEWIGFVDADDVIHRDMYKTLHEVMTCDTIKIAQIKLKEFHGKVQDGLAMSGEEQDCEIESINTLEYLKQLLMHEGDSSMCTKLFRKSLFDSFLFKEHFSNEDFEFLVRLLIHDNEMQVISINREMYFYRQHNESMTHSGFTKAIIDCVYNAEYAYKMVSVHYPELLLIAQRFCLVQHEQFLRKIPLELMNDGNEYYVKVIKYIRANWLKALRNQYVTLHQKRNILAFAICPRWAKKIYGKYFGKSEW